MSDIPNTTSTEVAIIAAALKLSETKVGGSVGQQDFFEARLRRYLTAYKAIRSAAEIYAGEAHTLDVEALVAQMEKDLKIP